MTGSLKSGRSGLPYLSGGSSPESVIRNARSPLSPDASENPGRFTSRPSNWLFSRHGSLRNELVLHAPMKTITAFNGGRAGSVKVHADPA